MRIGISFDLRNPAQWFKPWDRHYGATLELINHAESLGVEVIKFTEHHGFSDGYSPQPQRSHHLEVLTSPYGIA